MTTLRVTKTSPIFRAINYPPRQHDRHGTAWTTRCALCSRNLAGHQVARKGGLAVCADRSDCAAAKKATST